MSRQGFITVSCAMALALATPAARAQSDASQESLPALPAAGARPGATQANRELAVIHYERGRQHYAAGRYRLAVYELETAHSLDPTGTNLLINLGTVHERLGNIDGAILSYERHLALVTDPDERARTQRILTRLRGARVELADISRRRGRADALFWVSAGAGLACTTLGIVMLATARPGDSSAAPVAFTASGLSLGILATVLYFARDAPPRQTLFVGASFAPGAPSLGVAGSF